MSNESTSRTAPLPSLTARGVHGGRAGSSGGYKRSRKVVQPGFQLRLVGTFTGIGVLALLLQFLIVGFRLSRAVSEVEVGGGHIADEIPSVMIDTLVFSLGMLVPLLFGLGILLTFRVAGPAFRMESYLRALARGEVQGPCSIRKGDHLQSLCDAVNEAVESLQGRASAAGDDAPELERAA